MLIAHVEREGVWLIEGGMRKLADALAALVRRQGGDIRCNAPVAEIVLREGRAEAVRLASGETLQADAVICNADVNAVATGGFGDDARRAVEAVPPPRRSLSAMTWAMVGGARRLSAAAAYGVLLRRLRRRVRRHLSAHGARPASPPSMSARRIAATATAPTRRPWSGCFAS